MVEYGEFLLNVDDDGDACERRAARAFRLFQSASERGDKTSHFYLGLMHRQRLIEAPNPKAAFHHFAVAANEGDESEADSARTISQSLRRRSQYELARCYLEGYGADRDTKAGLAMLERIGKDDGDAAYMLSQIYVNGRFGVSVNTLRGMAWKRESAKLGNGQGAEEMDELYRAKGREVVHAEVPDVDVYDGQEAPM